MPAVRAENVWKTYDRVRWVLQDVTLDVDPGEVVVLMGRSGSGKTTLLNLLAGLDTPTRGRVLVEDVDIGGLDEDERTEVRLNTVGVAFQRFHLIPELTLEENVRLPMTLAGRTGAKQRARKLLRFFDLTDQANAFPGTLSGGETQRAALARALGNDPAVLLADEPTANLDDDNARTALRAIRTVADKLGTGVLVATHDPMARDAGDRVLHITDGRIGGSAPTGHPRRGPTGAERPRPAPER